MNKNGKPNLFSEICKIKTTWSDYRRLWSMHCVGADVVKDNVIGGFGIENGKTKIQVIEQLWRDLKSKLYSGYEFFVEDIDTEKRISTRKYYTIKYDEHNSSYFHIYKKLIHDYNYNERIIEVLDDSISNI